jgi:prepilin-type processing-associated H-X9-DG protein
MDCMDTFSSVTYGWKSARSRHPGEVNALYGDGSVHFVKNSINNQVWMGIGTRAGGEIANPDQ